jgi:outer membrane protein OmpA-like peptidoglycan-associated protein
MNSADAAPRDDVNPHKVKGHFSYVPFLVVEALSIAIFTMIGALVIVGFFDHRLPPVVFGPVAYSETLPPPIPLPQPEPPPGIVNATYSVFFSNGSSRIDDVSGRFLRSLSDGLADCPGIQISVLGSTSSLPYRGDPKDAKNTELSIKRATKVSNYLHSYNTSLSPQVRNVPLKRRYYDVRTDSKKPRPSEQLNRRVDIVLNEADCQMLAVAPSAPH